MLTGQTNLIQILLNVRTMPIETLLTNGGEPLPIVVFESTPAIIYARVRISTEVNLTPAFCMPSKKWASRLNLSNLAIKSFEPVILACSIAASSSGRLSRRMSDSTSANFSNRALAPRLATN
jgi:hypothetical protein